MFFLIVVSAVRLLNTRVCEWRSYASLNHECMRVYLVQQNILWYCYFVAELPYSAESNCPLGCMKSSLALNQQSPTINSFHINKRAKLWGHRSMCEGQMRAMTNTSRLVLMAIDLLSLMLGLCCVLDPSLLWARNQIHTVTASHSLGYPVAKKELASLQPATVSSCKASESQACVFPVKFHPPLLSAQESYFPSWGAAEFVQVTEAWEVFS